MPDNPITEPADLFYATDEAPDSDEKTETETVTNEERSPSADESATETEPEKSEESEAEAEAETEDTEESETQYLELDGTEYSLKQVKQWKAGHLMQSDYTKKTQALSDERKTFEQQRDTERKSIAEATQKASNLADQLEVLVGEDAAIDWADLKEFNPDEYISKKEKADARAAKLAEIKSARTAPVDSPEIIQAEQKKLFDSNPGWMEDGKPTEQFTADTTMLQEYAINNGIAAEEFSQLTQANYLNIILKAAKYDQLQDKARETKQKREKIPIVTRPKAAKPKGEPKSMADVFYS